ncbi:MAG: nitronate monooxygenase, partial [Nitrospira sp.]|nr:nitronate monooxygenase [Nitrospira sp.]
LSPNVTDIASFARVCEEEGADGLSVINTLLGMSIDIETWRPRLGNITGGLSGPAIRPVALRMVWQVCNAVKIPVIGMGGIITSNDAVEFFLAGAGAVAVGTANFINPGASLEIIAGLEAYLESRGLNNITEITGKLRTGF